MGKKQTTKKIANLAILTAFSIILALVVRFPILPSAPYLEYDMADVPIFVGTFLYGPISGFFLTIVVSFIQGFTVSASSGIYGVIMHICSTGSYVLMAGTIYYFKRDFKGAIISMLAGIITWLVVIIPLNLYITPLFLGTKKEAILKILLPTILPFNLIKVLVNSFITFLLYKRVQKVFLKIIPNKNKQENETQENINEVEQHD